MHFDSLGNLYLYEPGAGMSGILKRLIKYGSEEVIYADGDVQSKFYTIKNHFHKFDSVALTKIHRIVPRNGAVITKLADNKAKYFLMFLLKF